MAFRIKYDPSNTGTIELDNNTGSFLPYKMGSLWPLWDEANQLLTLQPGQFIYTPVLGRNLYSNISVSSDGGSTYSTPASFAALVAWVNTYLFVDAGTGSGSIPTKRVTIAPTISTSAYSTGYCIGGKQEIDILATSNGTGTLVSIQIIEEGNQAAPIDILLFSADPSSGTYADHATPTYATSDMAKAMHTISVTSYKTYGGYSIADTGLLGLDLVGTGGNTKLYIVAIIRASATYNTANSIWFNVGIYQNS